MVVLNMMSSALKDLAVDLKIFVSSSTQLNRGSEDSKTGVKNQNNIRGAISIIDKCDIAYIFARTTPDELEAIEPFIQKIGIIPNQVADLYKVRRGRFNNVRIWSYFDYGTCRKRDLFITNGDYTPVEDFIAIKFMNKDCGNYHDLLIELNNEIKTSPKTVAPSQEEVVLPKEEPVKSTIEKKKAQKPVEETLAEEGVSFF